MIPLPYLVSVSFSLFVTWFEDKCVSRFLKARVSLFFHSTLVRCSLPLLPHCCPYVSFAQAPSSMVQLLSLSVKAPLSFVSKLNLKYTVEMCTMYNTMWGNVYANLKAHLSLAFLLSLVIVMPLCREMPGTAVTAIENEVMMVIMWNLVDNSAFNACCSVLQV